MTTALATLPPRGVESGYFEETVDLGTAAASFSLAKKIPARAIVLAVSLVLPTAISATTAVKVGLGRVTSSADPDKYLLTPTLVAQSIPALIIPNAILAAEETIGIFACATDGSAAGTIGGAGQTAQVSVSYIIPRVPE